jgi:hypothetical protein
MAYVSKKDYILENFICIRLTLRMSWTTYISSLLDFQLINGSIIKSIISHMDTADPNFHATNLSVVELIIGRGI